MLDFDNLMDVSCTRIGKTPILKTFPPQADRATQTKDKPEDKEAIQACLTCTHKKCNGDKKCMEHRKEAMKAEKEVRRKMEVCDLINNVKVYGLEDSVKASKYPMSVDVSKCTDEITPRVKSLGQCETGSGHDQFLTGIIVQFDLTLTVKAWTEAERYHFFDFVSSQSTMHRITKFNLDDAYIGYVDKRIIEIMKEKVSAYNDLEDGERKAEKYLEILYSNPCGMKLTARMTTNYRQLKTIYHQRKNHRLPEWKVFCKWVETLPHFVDMILKTDTGE